MRRLIVLVITFAAGLLVLAAPPASAGGPTSVLIVNHDGFRAAGALTGSRAYEDLSRALDTMNPPVGEATPPGGFMDANIRLTWMIHDVTPWRIDAVTIDGDEVWVSTTMTPEGGGGDQGGTRHKAKDADLLIATLGALGILGDTSRSTPSASNPPPAAAGTPAAGYPDAPSATTLTGPTSAVSLSRTTPAEWSMGIAGVLIALVGGLLLGRRTAPDLPRDATARTAWPEDSVGLTPSGRAGPS